MKKWIELSYALLALIILLMILGAFGVMIWGAWMKFGIWGLLGASLITFVLLPLVFEGD